MACMTKWQREQWMQWSRPKDEPKRSTLGLLALAFLSLALIGVYLALGG